MTSCKNLFRFFTTLTLLAGSFFDSETTLAAQSQQLLEDHPRYVIQIFARPGENAAVVLPQNATTGYIWQLEPLATDAPVELAGETILLSSNTEKIAGSSGAIEWRFKILKSGRTLIHAIYARPWEKHLHPAMRATVEIIAEAP